MERTTVAMLPPGLPICIGMPFAQLEAKLLLATILQYYTLELVLRCRLELHPLVTLRPRQGMPLVLRTAVDSCAAIAEPT